MGDFGQHVQVNDFVPGILERLRERQPQTKAELVGRGPEDWTDYKQSALAFCIATKRVRQRPDGMYELVPTAPDLVDVFDLDPAYHDFHG